MAYLDPFAMLHYTSMCAVVSDSISVCVCAEHFEPIHSNRSTFPFSVFRCKIWSHAYFIRIDLQNGSLSLSFTRRIFVECKFCLCIMGNFGQVCCSSREKENAKKRSEESKKNRSIKLSKLILKLDFGKRAPNLAGCLFLVAQSQQ